MRSRSFLIILWGLLFLIITLDFLFGQTKKEGILQRFLTNATPLTAGTDKVLKEMESAYRLKDYPKVLQLLGKLPPSLELSPEEFLMVAESFYQTGEPDKASDFAKRAISLRRGTELSCQAELLSIKSLFLMGREKEALRALEELEKGFCSELKGDKIKILKSLLSQKWNMEIDNKLLLSELEELLFARFNYLIKKGDLKGAEQSALDYLNLTGDYQKGKNLFFPLAEAYLKKGEIPRAKKYYQLIITEWDPTKESFFSKFRLYQIAYESTRIKELLPPKTIEDLMMYITQIKTKYPQDKIAEEASLLEIEILFNQKDWVRTRKSATEFIERYPENPKLPKVYDYYCQASIALVPVNFLQGKVGDLQRIAKDERDLLVKTGCGVFYYNLGKEFYRYNIYTLSSYYLLSAENLPLPQEIVPDYYLKLAFLAEIQGEVEVSDTLFTYLQKNFAQGVKDQPEYLFLKTKKSLSKDLNSGVTLLRQTLRASLPPVYKQELIFQALSRAIREKKFALAYELIQIPDYDAKEKDYLWILSETFTKDPKLFEVILRDAKKKFPQSSGILWLEAYHLERKGELKRTTQVWGNLTQGEGLPNRLARQYERIRKLTERAQKLVY
mgnify:CR=1 FL=1